MKAVKKFLFDLFNFVMSTFCFDKLIKISENASALQNTLLITNTE